MNGTCKHCGARVTSSADVRKHWFCTKSAKGGK